MSLAIDGLVSGLDTTSLINQLMTIESQPQTLLKNKVTTTQTLVNALQGLNSSVASLATVAKRTALPATVDLFTASASASSVSVTAASGASAGQLDGIDLLAGLLLESGDTGLDERGQPFRIHQRYFRFCRHDGSRQHRQRSR